jgi:hypothetical protein
MGTTMNGGREMHQRNAGWRFWSLLGLAAATAGLSGCEVPRSDDINRVQPGFVKKSLFQGGDQWHYRRTVADSETVNSVVIEGSGDIWIDRVVFEVQENLLLARKPYNAIPGAGLDVLPGNEDFDDGVVLAAWPILSHFDIIRNYDELTGRETNEIVENTVDRPWYEREYMRVNFADNIVEGSFFGSFAFGWSPIQFNSTGSYWKHITEYQTDPYASRFSDDYMEITDNVILGMDVFTCFAFAGFSITRLFDLEGCGFGEAKVRHSFKKITEPNDFEERFYPDSYIVKDDSGEPLEDPDTREVVREGIYERFGVFRLTTPTYDRGYGFTEEGRQFRAMIFDIWEDSVDEAGATLPYAQRQEKPIIYYLNAEYPSRYREVARQVAADYNQVFKGMVASLKGVSEDEVLDMFEIRDNDCNEANIISTVLANQDLVPAVERGVCRENEVCVLPRGDTEALQKAMEERIGIGNLTRVCTSMEEATRDPVTGVSAFDWQRIGDLRFNMLVWLSNPQRSGWGGYGPMHADALTGETISATSFLRGVSYEIGAANVADYICFMNDEPGCSTTDIIYGRDIRRQVGRVEDRVIEMATERPSDSAIAELSRRMASLSAHNASSLPQDSTGSSISQRLDRLKGHPIETQLLDDATKALMSGGYYKPWLGMDEPDWLKQDLSLNSLIETANLTSPSRNQARAVLEAGGFCFLEQDFDPHWAGLALDLKDLSRDDRYQAIANRLVKHVILHELGHNVGLAHNFEGTYDALNYNARFWENVRGTPEQQVQNNLDEFRHTTVMEYMSSKGLFADFLGSYDEAAIRFAYGNQVQVFASDAFQSEGGEALEEWRLYNDYRRIPDHLCGGDCGDDATRMDVLTNREWVQFDPQNPPANEVPYMFCDNFINRQTPFCATFDYGSNLSEIQANNYNLWKLYFPFNSFARGRLSPFGWNIGGAFLPLSLIWDTMDTTSQYYQILSATDPNFPGTDLEADMVGVLLNSMNIFTEVLSLPEMGRYCPIGQTESGRRVYQTSSLLDACDDDLPIDDPTLVEQGAIDLNIGDARPLFIALTEPEFEERDIWYIGSFFDKQRVAILVGNSFPRLFRFNYQLDRRNFFLTTYRIFEPEMRELFYNMVEFDGFQLTLDLLENISSYWCKDPAAPNRNDLGYIEPKRMFDMAGEGLSAFPDSSESCLDPGFIDPSFFRNLSDIAILAGHVILSSDIDARLDFGKEMKLWAVGAYDEPDYLTTANFALCDDPSSANEDCICSYTDALTGVEYRSINRLQDNRISIGCQLIESAQDLADIYDNSSGDPGIFSIWRFGVEKLEFNRELYRIFQDR